MAVRSRRGWIAFWSCTASALVLASLAVLASTPTHRSHILIGDPEEPNIPPDFNAVALEGRRDHDTYVVTLTVSGRIRDSNYVVGVLVQDAGNPGGTYVYRLSYEFGSETSYRIATTRSDQSLTFQFPLTLLRAPSGAAYVVGLDAALFAFDATDYVNEGPRETLRIHRLLSLPVDASLLLVASAAIGFGTIFAALRVCRR